MTSSHRPRPAPSLLRLAGIALSVLIANGVANASEPPGLDGIQRLSIAVRGMRLTAPERDEVKQMLTARDFRSVHRTLAERWTHREEFYRRLTPLYKGGGGNVVSSAGFERLSAQVVEGRKVYYLDDGQRTPGQPPCAKNDQIEVLPWWSVKTPVTICRASYVPERVFDGVGFCSGQAEPEVPTPRRSGCGCGPLLLACIPGDSGLADSMDAQAVDEIKKTSATVMLEDRPYDELLTTTKTWQTGLVEFLYLRRELLAEVQKQPWTPAFEKALQLRVAAIDLDAPGHWVERKGIYANAGLYTSTPAAFRSIPTHRALIRMLYATFLCSGFESIHVDSDVLLRAVGNRQANTRSLFSFINSPMRTQVGCSGCHAPLDGGSAMLIELSTPLMGNLPTHVAAPGQLYVNGLDDLRGNGTGMAALSRLMVAQDEFATCTVRRTFGELLGRDATIGEKPFQKGLVEEFTKSGHRMSTLVRALLAYAAERGE